MKALRITLGFVLLALALAVYPTAQSALSNSYTDGAIWLSAQAMSCNGATSGTAGSGNNTLILDGSMPALKVSSTNAAGSTATFTCQINEVPSRTTSGKGLTLNTVTVVYSVQTTTATSMATPTLTSITAPAAGTSESASSATPVAAACGTLTMSPVVGSANLTAVSAGQYYTELITCGTPLALNSALQTVLLTFAVAQSASAAQIVTVAGAWLGVSNVVL